MVGLSRSPSPFLSLALSPSHAKYFSSPGTCAVPSRTANMSLTISANLLLSPLSLVLARCLCFSLKFTLLSLPTATCELQLWREKASTL